MRYTCKYLNLLDGISCSTYVYTFRCHGYVNLFIVDYCLFCNHLCFMLYLYIVVIYYIDCMITLITIKIKNRSLQIIVIINCNCNHYKMIISKFSFLKIIAPSAFVKQKFTFF